MNWESCPWPASICWDYPIIFQWSRFFFMISLLISTSILPKGITMVDGKKSYSILQCLCFQKGGCLMLHIIPTFKESSIFDGFSMKISIILHHEFHGSSDHHHFSWLNSPFFHWKASKGHIFWPGLGLMSWVRDPCWRAKKSPPGRATEPAILRENDGKCR